MAFARCVLPEQPGLQGRGPLHRGASKTSTTPGCCKTFCSNTLYKMTAVLAPMSSDNLSNTAQLESLTPTKAAVSAPMTVIYILTRRWDDTYTSNSMGNVMLLKIYTNTTIWESVSLVSISCHRLWLEHSHKANIRPYSS